MRTAFVIGITIGLAAAASPSAAQSPDGQALYHQHCRACHGANGVPSERMAAIYKSLAPLDSAFLAGRSEDSLAVVLRNGIGQMKGYKEKLTPEQIIAIATYVMTLPSSSKSP